MIGTIKEMFIIGLTDPFWFLIIISFPTICFLVSLYFAVPNFPGEKMLNFFKWMLDTFTAPRNVALIFLVAFLIYLRMGYLYMYNLSKPPEAPTGLNISLTDGILSFSIGGEEPPHGIRPLWRDLYVNGIAELISIGLTVFVIDLWNKNRANKAEKNHLILQLGSDSRVIATDAARILARKGHLDDGSLKGANLGGADLSQVMFHKIQLPEADLRGSNLRGTTFSHAKMRKVELQQACLDHATIEMTDLRGANMENASFKEATLSSVDLRNTVMFGTRFKGAKFLNHPQMQGAELNNTDFTLATMMGVHLENADLHQTNFAEANLTRVYMQKAKLNDVNMYRAKLVRANLKETHFASVDLREADLQHANLQLAQFDNTNLRNADLRNADLRNASLIGADLVGVDLRGANLEGADLRYAKLVTKGNAFMYVRIDETTILPDGTYWIDEEQDTDLLSCFTNPNHPAFFKPDWVK